MTQFYGTSNVVLGSPAAVTAAGTTQATAASGLQVGCNVLTSATSQTGATLPSGLVNGTSGQPSAGPGQAVVVSVPSSVTASAVVYPATSTGSINGLAAGTGITIPAAKTAIFINKDGNDNWMSILSA